MVLNFMTIKRYIKRPFHVSAVQWSGNNINEIRDFTNYNAKLVEKRRLRIKTISGMVFAKETDWIVLDSEEGYYVVSDEAFQKRYKEADRKFQS